MEKASSDRVTEIVRTCGQRLCFFFLCAGSGVSFAQPASGIYMWRDAQGLVHFSDRPALPRSGEVKHLPMPVNPAVRVDVPTAAPKAGVSRQTGSDHGVEAGVEPRSKSHGAPPDTSVEEDCEKLWVRYFASAACYSPFRTKRGMKGGAYEACGEPVKDPSDRCVRRN